MAYGRIYEITIADQRLSFRNFIVGEFIDASGRRITRDLEPEDLSEIPSYAKIIKPPLQMIFSSTLEASGSSDGVALADLKLYNLNEEVKALFSKKGAYVKIRAGYEDTKLYELFSGEVVTSSTSRETADRITNVTLKESSSAVNFLRINKKYPHNTPFFYILRDLVKLAGQSGLAKGYIQEPNYDVRAIYENFADPESPDHTRKQSPTTYIIEGYWKDAMDEVCGVLAMTWYVLNSKIYVIAGKKGRTSKTTSGYGTTIYEKNLKSPLESLTDNSNNQSGDTNVGGIKFTTFLSPNITPASYIDMKVDGFKGSYKVIEVTHKLDYRGAAWDTEVEAIRIE